MNTKTDFYHILNINNRHVEAQTLFICYTYDACVMLYIHISHMYGTVLLIVVMQYFEMMRLLL